MTSTYTPGRSAGAASSNDLGYRWYSVDSRLFGSASGQALTAGVAYVQGGPLLADMPAGTYTVRQYNANAVGGATTLAGCYVGLYDDAKALLGASGDRSGAWTAAGPATATVTTTTDKHAGDWIYQAFLIATQSATQLQLARLGGVSTILANGARDTTQPLFATTGTGLSTLPATLGTFTLSQYEIFAAIL